MPGFGFPAGELTPALSTKVTAPLGPSSAPVGAQSAVVPFDEGVYKKCTLFSSVALANCCLSDNALTWAGVIGGMLDDVIALISPQVNAELEFA